MEPEQRQTLEVALKYLSIGWSVIPIRHPDNPPKGRPDDTKVPHVKWKPYQTKLPTPTELKDWWEKWPNAQIGVITGKLSGFISLDFDTPIAMERFRYTVAQIPETIGQKTGRAEGGSQYFFKYPLKESIKSKNAIAKNIDLKGDGGYVVVPPSLHKSGTNYEWMDIDPVEDGLDDLIPLEDCPDIMHFCISIRAESAPIKPGSVNGLGGSTNKPGWVNDLLWGVTEGSRDVSCTKLAGYYLRQNNGDIEDTIVALSGWNARNNPPLEEGVVLKCVKSIAVRHKTDKLSDYLGIDIINVERLLYPDGDVRYNVYVDGQSSCMQINIEQFTNSRLFRNKFADFTKILISPIKDGDWHPLVRGVIDESVTLEMSDDETIIGSVKNIISLEREMAAEDPEKPLEYLQNGFVIVKGKLFFNTDILISRLKEVSGVVVKSKKDLGIVLRRIGFENKPKKVNGMLFRSWSG